MRISHGDGAWGCRMGKQTKPIPNRRSPESIHPTEPLFSLLKVESDHEAEAAFSVLYSKMVLATPVSLAWH